MMMEPAKIAIIGSHLPEIVGGSERHQLARGACKEIGRELAGRGFHLVVYSHKPRFIEADVVSGFVEADLAKQNSIIVYYPQADNIRFSEQATHDDLFRPIADNATDWEASFYQSLSTVDGVLLLGGGQSTLIAGHVAISQGVPVVAIAAFGGKAQTIWTHLANKDCYRNSRDLQAMSAWDQKSASVCIEGLQKRCERRLKEKQVELETKLRYEEGRAKQEAAMNKERSMRLHTLAALGSFVVLLAFVLRALAYDISTGTYIVVFFLGLVAAGSLGATARMLSLSQPDSPILATIVLGAVAGFIVGVTYAIPLWIAAPEVLNTIHAIEPKNKIQLISAIVVGVSAGVGFDIVFERLKKAVVEKLEDALKKMPAYNS